MRRFHQHWASAQSLAANAKNRFNGFRSGRKPLKRLVHLVAVRTWLKPGVNEIGKLWQWTTVLTSLLVIHSPHRLISAVVGGRLFGRENEISCHPPARWLRLCR